MEPFKKLNNSSYKRELRFRAKFQNAIQSTYSKIISEFVDHPRNMFFFIQELHKQGYFDDRTKENLLDCKSHELMAEKLFSEISLSSAAAMRTFIRLFKENARTIYCAIITENTCSNGKFDVNKTECEFFDDSVRLQI